MENKRLVTYCSTHWVELTFHSFLILLLLVCRCNVFCYCSERSFIHREWNISFVPVCRMTIDCIVSTWRPCQNAVNASCIRSWRCQEEWSTPLIHQAHVKGRMEAAFKEQGAYKLWWQELWYSTPQNTLYRPYWLWLYDEQSICTAKTKSQIKCIVLW